MFGSTVSMGTWSSTSASGMFQFKNGFWWDSLIGFEVVLPTGEIVRTGVNAYQNCEPIGRYTAAGDIQGLFVGSYGALGVLTEVTYSIFPVHERTDRTL